MNHRSRRWNRPMTHADKETVESRRVVLAAALALFLPGRAAADLTGHQEGRAALAGKSDDVLIATNPELERLARGDPALLREVLGRLRAPAASYTRSLMQARSEPETPAESAVLAENPDLAELYRESPEAALDLLRLIREAAKKK